jgi:peptidoglycan-N-acetylglucosamine deacetylase
MMTLAIAAGLSVSAASYYALPHGLRQWQQRRLRRLCASNCLLALTYDDGPGALLTPRLLDLLDRRQSKATFFLAGFRAQEHPAIAQRIADAGHQVGCHSDRHLNAWKTWPWKAVKDIDAGYETLSRWVASDGMFRPPHGKLTLATWDALRRRRAPIGWWTIASGDTYAKLPRPEVIVQRVRQGGGGVVVMHDFDRSPERVEFVLQTTDQLLEAAAREGWRVCTLQDLRRNRAEEAEG